MIRPSKISWYNLRRLWTPRKEYGHHDDLAPDRRLLGRDGQASIRRRCANGGIAADTNIDA
jgi:hypothetical protein